MSKHLPAASPLTWLFKMTGEIFQTYSKSTSRLHRPQKPDNRRRSLPIHGQVAQPSSAIDGSLDRRAEPLYYLLGPYPLASRKDLYADTRYQPETPFEAHAPKKNAFDFR